MRPNVLLISGNEPRFVNINEGLEKHLKEIGCQTFHYVLKGHIFITLSIFWRYIRQTETNQPFLMVYCGHGGRKGWGHPFLGILPYWLISLFLMRIHGPLFLVNDTCYGLNFLDYIKCFRKKENTGFLSAWDSDEACYGGPCRDILEYWPKANRPEDVLGDTQLYCVEGERDREVPLHQRWGIHFDHFFFPKEKSEL